MTMHEGATALQDTVREVVAAHRGQRGALLPVLHALQARWGFVPAEATSLVAAELNLSRADVHGVVSFYHDFRSAPEGRTAVRICRAEACQALGAEQLVADAREACGLSPGQTSADGSVTLEQVFCLGNCALGPSVQVNGRVQGRMDARRLRSLLGEGSAR